MKREEVLRLKRKLRYSWNAFFSRFSNLTPIQCASIPPILQGENVVISSPTASGKTEAVVAPTAERLRSENWQGLSVVYVTPTRALANDLHERLQRPLQEMSIDVEAKHGDRPYLRKGIQFLITTPESLDSLICRQPTTLESVRTVILDEVHLIDGTYRGDQLRVLLSRLHDLTETQANVHVVSATLSDPQRVGERYTSHPCVIEIDGHRDFEVHFAHSVVEIVDILKYNRWFKSLWFHNKREAVEATANELKEHWGTYPVVLHHGKLSKAERETSEHLMKVEETICCVATSTLEIGIDIGNVDVVVLMDIPFGLSSMQQRIGRGNRRSDIVRVIAHAPDMEQTAIWDDLLEAARTGQRDSSHYEPDLSVIVQQVFSLLFQNRSGCSLEQMERHLSVLGTSSQIRTILEHLQSEGWLEFNPNRKRWIGSTKLIDEGEKGRIHSNIPDSGDYVVIDATTGKEVGRIYGLFDQVFILAGRVWKVEFIKRDRIYASRIKAASMPALFQLSNAGGKYETNLPAELR